MREEKRGDEQQHALELKWTGSDFSSFPFRPLHSPQTLLFVTHPHLACTYTKIGITLIRLVGTGLGHIDASDHS